MITASQIHNESQKYIDLWFRQVAFNRQRGFNIFKKQKATA